MALTAEQISALLSGSRSKGQYNTYLEQFLESGEGGVCVNDEWADLAGKSASTLKQGFENAKAKSENENAKMVKVLTAGEDKESKQVFLINLAAANVELAAA